MTEPSAEYVFRVRFSLQIKADVRVDPETFETTIYRPAESPGETGWLFFRDNLWRGAVNDEQHFRETTETTLSVPIESITFSELRTSQAYLDELKAAIESELDRSTFGAATSVSDVLKQYLGSSIHVTS